MHDLDRIAACGEVSGQQKDSMPDDDSLRSFSTAMDKSLASSIIGFETYEFKDHEKLQGLSDFDLNSQNVSAYSSSQVTQVPSDQLPPPVDNPTRGDEPRMSIIHQVAFVFVACLAQFLSLGAMNQTVAPVLVLAKYFHVLDYGNLSWFSAAYSMTVGTFILPAGMLISSATTANPSHPDVPTRSPR